MPAAATDYLLKGARRFSTTLSSSVDASTGTIPLTSVTNLPTDTGIEIVIDRVDTNGTLTPNKEEVVRGIVSGSSVINSVRGVEGTAQTHSAGAVVEVRLTADMWNRMATAFLVEHGQDGTHGATIVKTTGAQNITGAKTHINAVITDPSNNVMAKSLKSATTTVDVSAAAAPTSGQVLTATGGSAATWQTPSSSVVAEKGTSSGAFTTTSTTITDSNATGSSVSITTTATCDILVTFTAFAQNDTDSAYYTLGIGKGTNTAQISGTIDPAHASTGDVRTLTFLDTGVTAGTYTYRMMAAAQPGKTTRILAGSTISAIAFPA